MKKAKQLKLIFMCCELLLALVAIFMIFIPALGVKNSDTTYSGLNVVFGYKIEDTNTYLFTFSFMNLLTYILVIAAIVLIILKYIVKKGKILNIVIFALLVVAGIFFFLTKAFTAINETAVKTANLINAISAFLGGNANANAKDAFVIAAGPIVSGILCLLGALVCCCDFLVVKK